MNKEEYGMTISMLITKTLDRIAPLDNAAMSTARMRQNQLTKPSGSLGKLEELAIQIAGIQANPMPVLSKKAIALMAGDHGVIAEKVVNWPQEVTAGMVRNILQGGAAINVMARQVGTKVIVIDMGVASEMGPLPDLIVKKVASGTGNIAKGPAMTVSQAVESIEVGIDIVEDEIKRGLDIIGTGEMGICNTTPSSAIYAALSGRPVAEVTGRGTGIDDAQLRHKISVIQRALDINRPDPRDPIDIVAKVGGFEIAGLAGVMLGAASHRIPVVMDGFITGAAALIATGLAPTLKDYIIPSHVSAEAGHKGMLDYMGFKPLMNLDMRLGEGTGAALGIFMAELAVRILSEMATFSEADISEGDVK